MSIRHNFVLQALSPGSNISALCREYNVSRKTGYKWLHRYRVGGVLALDNLDRGPAAGRPLKVSAEMAIEVLNIRDAHPTWGTRKLQVMLKRQYPAKEVPSERTIGRILTRAGRVKPRRVRGRKSSPSKRSELEITASNQVWTVDFKGWWRTRRGRLVHHLTGHYSEAGAPLPRRCCRSSPATSSASGRCLPESRPKAERFTPVG